MKLLRSIFLLVISVNAASISAQEIPWLTFEQLEDSLAVQPKKVVINFYTDWCSYCKKMDKVGFAKPEVIKRINESYYAVKMNAETKDTISFGGQQFTNKELQKKRRANHEIALLLGAREGLPFSLPVVVVMNEKFQVTQRYFEYLSPKKMLDAFK